MAEEYNYKDEILSSRVGFLGGSDGAMLAKIAGLGYVPTSCNERLAICKGIYTKEDYFVTEAMALGDKIENQIYDMLYTQDERWQSNPRIESKKYKCKNVGLLAHLDFVLVDEDKKIVTFIECKATNKTIKEARRNYINQLYIESVLGKEYTNNIGRAWKFNLKLCHYNTDGYDGVLDPDKIELIKVTSHSLFNIHQAMNIVDEYLEHLTEYYKDEVEAQYLPQEVKDKCDAINVILSEIKEREAQVDEFKAKMYKLMCDKDIKSIKTDYFAITRVDDTETTSFDSKRFKEDHKTLYKKYTRISKRKGYATIKVKEDKNKE